jgi:hypothetical protein
MVGGMRKKWRRVVNGRGQSHQIISCIHLSPPMDHCATEPGAVSRIKSVGGIAVNNVAKNHVQM